ncbi:PQQ-binding-like beta-propeller repeat protein [Promicromonospora sp. NPDC023805]|uniref:outer membrane protein assembly factor BamB family protein n=1 Tax=Promicromonospora sp. NPDC023805 TaxID=3154696 RepID=UPI0033D01D1C
MLRDPDEGSAFVFDLVEHDEPDPDRPPVAPGANGTVQAAAPAVADDADREPDAPAARGTDAWRRTVPTVAAVLAIALGTGIASDGVRDAARIERMRDFGGGVEDVSTPLTEKWVWDGDVGLVDRGLGGTDAIVLGDILAFQSGRDLVALDPATGEEAWVVPLGDDPACGPTGVSPDQGAPARSVSMMVCLYGAAADREAVSVRPDGTVSAPRTLDPSDTRRHGSARPGPDGTVLRAMRIGPESEVDLGDARCEDSGECTGTVAAGRDVGLRAESAVTGEELWTVTVPFEGAEAWECWDDSWEDPNGGLAFDGEVHPDGFGGHASADLVRLYGCGVAAAVTPDGLLLDPEPDPGTGHAESLALGGYAWLDQSGPARTVIYDDDGAVVVDVSGHVRGPSVADGAGPDTLLGTDETGGRLLAYDADGLPRWDIAAQAPEHAFLAQVGRTVVVRAQGAEDVRGLDVDTGTERWRWDTPAAGDWVIGTFTDGRAVLLHLIQADSGLPRMVSLDAASGELLWQESDEAATSRMEAASSGPDDEEVAVPALVAVDGRLLEVSRNGVRGLG